jgi:hypothetical protein
MIQYYVYQILHSWVLKQIMGPCESFFGNGSCQSYKLCVDGENVDGENIESAILFFVSYAACKIQNPWTVPFFMLNKCTHGSTSCLQESIK